MKLAQPEVWVWVERKAKSPARVSLELVGKAKELAQKLGGKTAAVIIGDHLDEMVSEATACGAEKVYLTEDPRLDLYQSMVYARLMADLIRKYKPEIVLLGATSLGKDLASRTAARVGTGLTAHCVDLYVEEIQGRPQLVQVVPGWGGNMMLKIACLERRPQMATVRPGILEKPLREEGRKSRVLRITPEIREEDGQAHTVEMVARESLGTSLGEADIVVAGGWGLNSIGGFEPVRQLAKMLGGVVAGTRPAVDKGWVPEEYLIGQSGKTVSPKLFISLGASGAMHFTTGFLKSRVVLAVDQNPEAAIFESCDLGIVGDLREVVPCLLQELQSLGGPS